LQGLCGGCGPQGKPRKVLKPFAINKTVKEKVDFSLLSVYYCNIFVIKAHLFDFERNNSMNDTVILVGIGLILGALLSSGVWLVLYVLNKAERQLAREKNLLIKSIADEAAEADKVLSSVVSKAMNAHALRSALLPKIDKMHKILTANMHSLDIYFVKYMELRIAWYKAAFEEDETQADAAADQSPGDMQLRQAAAAPEAAVQDNRGRMESPPPTAQYKAPALPQSPDLRTEVLSVGPGPRPETPVRRQGFDIPAQRPPAARQPFVEKRPAPAPERIPPAARPPQSIDEPFDFEKAMPPQTDQKPVARPGGQFDNRAMPIDHSEQTLQWDRNQLMGAAAPPEAIVVEGSEVTRKARPPEMKPRPPAGPGAPAAPGAANKAGNSITGEDIENTMDSFFGLGDK
jgi:hypothetical protein